MSQSGDARPPQGSPGSGNGSGGWWPVVLSSLVMALALLGDTLLYAVLPAKAVEFGVSLTLVGLLLAANRLIRLVGYAWVLSIDRSIGTRRMTVLAALLGAATTFAYGLVNGAVLFLAARILWGLSYAALNLSTLAYATAVTEGVGARVGGGRSIRQIGPALSLSLGVFAAVRLGAQDVFLVLGVLSLLALPLALRLPELPPDRVAAGRSGPLLRRPRLLNVHFFLIGLIADGLFVIALGSIFLQSGAIEQTSDAAMIAAGMTLAFRRGMEIVAAPLGGRMADRLGADTMLFVLTLGVAAGIALIAFGILEAGVILVAALRPALAAVGPAIIAGRHPEDRKTELAANETWTDMGAAVGPLAGGLLLPILSLETIFLAASLWLVAGLALPGVVRSARSRLTTVPGNGTGR